ERRRRRSRYSSSLEKSGLLFSLKASAPSSPPGVLLKISNADIAIAPTAAWCSESTLKLYLRKRSAVGLFSAISSAQAFASAIRLPGSTTLLTRPQRSAVSASYWRQKYQISRAR